LKSLVNGNFPTHHTLMAVIQMFFKAPSFRLLLAFTICWQETHQKMRQRTWTVYDDIVHARKLTIRNEIRKLRFNLRISLQKFHHGKIRLAVEFENNTK